MPLGDSSYGSRVMPIGDETPPKRELGSVLPSGFYAIPWSDLTAFDDLEQNVKLAFPNSINTYHGMLTDPQVQGLRTGTTWPIFRMMWYIHPNGAREELVNKISADLNLPIAEKPEDVDLTKFYRRRTQNRFNFMNHIEEALDALVYGFMVFEQNGYISPKDGLFHYRKLAVRPPQTIDDIKLAPDGGIIAVTQNLDGAQPMPIDQLVVYSFGKRGANWHGRSLLRGCFAPWALKDKALRVGVMNIQKAGVGTPVFVGPPGASDQDLTKLGDLAQNFLAGDRSGGAVPYGTLPMLLGITGSQPNTVEFIKLMNEEMARSFFQMFMQLGQTTSGSRALGQTFVQYHKLVIEYVAGWFSAIFNEHVIEDDVEWNYGPDEEYAPLLCWAWDDNVSEYNPQGAEAQTDPSKHLRDMVEQGKLVVPDNDLDSLIESFESSMGVRGRRPAERRRHADGSAGEGAAPPSAAASFNGGNR